LNLQVIQSDEHILKIAFSGKIDTINLPGVEMKFYALINNHNSPVVLDFSEVTFLSSLGIRMLLTAAKDVSRQGFTLKIDHVKDDIRKVFEMAGLSVMLV